MPADSKTKSGKLLNKYFILLFIIGTCCGLGMYLFATSLALYVNSLGGGTSISGLLNISFAAFGLIGRFFSGYLSDNTSRIRVIMAGCLLFGVASLLYAFVPHFWAMAIFRAMQGSGFALANTAAIAAVSDVIPRERISDGIGLFSMNHAVSMVFGGSITFALIRGDDYSLVFYTAFGILMLAFILCFFCRYEKGARPQNAEEAPQSAPQSQLQGLRKYFDKNAVPAAACQFFVQLSFSAIAVFIFLYAGQKGYENPGLFYIFSAVAMLLCRGLLGRFTSSANPLPLLLISILIAISGVLMPVLYPGTFSFYYAGVCYGAALALTMPTLNALALRNAPADRRGVAASTFAISQDMSGGLGPVLWGFVIDLMGYNAMFIGTAIFYAFGAALSCLFFRPRKKSSILTEY